MVKVGDRIVYGTVEGSVKSVMGDMLIVTLQDGQDYPVNADQVKKVSSGAGQDLSAVMSVIKPHLKKASFIEELAKEMSKAGISELSILNGSINKFSAKESLEEIKAKKRAEAVEKADAEAQAEFDAQNA